MMTPTLSLVVLRVADIDAEALFYEALGFKFEKHAHGNGPEHYASEQDGLVFELYPSKEGEAHSNTLVGLSVESVVQAYEAGLAAGGRPKYTPHYGEWGHTASLLSPSGSMVILSLPKQQQSAE